ncbi:flagellar biosynthetic protein FliO [Tumebacillus sp. DT12]|uniref:Flagellar biosynthetic protein FliO n=1 Tax=Tumebacillus lacus TaxID=2995335 RepID=A0ABT3WV30_9BACL|nr:flagellar biosynthetic protein FliO [Tumebacillus lacus]MCX7568528.1 flagellar biosynthetic protein FliO [Tumebacillus lacus]
MRPFRTSRRILWSLTAAVLWLSSPSRVLAVDGSVEDAINKGNPGTAPAAPGVTTGDTSLLMSMIQLVFSLGIIIAIIYLLIRFLSSRSKNAFRGHTMQNLGAQSLTNNRSVHMLAIGDKVYVLGVGDNVTLLDTITDPDLVNQVKDDAEPTSSLNGNGWQGLQDLIQRLRKKSNPQVEEIGMRDIGFDQALREKLNNLKEQRTQSAQDWQEGRDL